jgi:hypothetical protein
VLGRHRVVISWHGKDAAFAEEERELTVYNVPGGHLIEFASRLRSPSGRVRIDGDPQHAGFQFRAHNDVDAFTALQTIFVRPDGVGKPGETRNWDPQTRQGPVNLPWNAMSFVLESALPVSRIAAALCAKFRSKFDFITRSETMPPEHPCG